MKLNLNVMLLSFLLSGTSVFAQPFGDSIPTHEVFNIQSQTLGELRTINVWKPVGYRSDTDALSVLYMLDGGIKEDFPHLANTLAELIQAKKVVPVILVGIENTQRRRDLTGQTDIEEDKAIAPIVGESAQFSVFIHDELFAEINKRYTTSKIKGIIGESLAGLFVVETFLSKPDMFDFYIAFDPSLWWNDKYLVKTANEYLDKFPKAQKTFWFASSQTEGIFETAEELAGILSAKNLKNLNWEYSPEPTEKHHTIFRATKEKALRWTLSNAIK